MKKVAAYSRKIKSKRSVPTDTIVSKFMEAKNKEKPWGEFGWGYTDHGKHIDELELLIVAIEGDRVDTVLMMDLPHTVAAFLDFLEVVNRKKATLIFPELAVEVVPATETFMIEMPKPFQVFAGDELS